MSEVRVEESDSGWWVYVYDRGAGAVIGPLSREDALRRVGPSLSGATLREPVPPQEAGP